MILKHVTDAHHLRDKTIPTRREQMEREEQRVNNELIRLALQQSATEATREETCE